MKSAQVSATIVEVIFIYCNQCSGIQGYDVSIFIGSAGTRFFDFQTVPYNFSHLTLKITSANDRINRKFLVNSKWDIIPIVLGNFNGQTFEVEINTMMKVVFDVDTLILGFRDLLSKWCLICKFHKPYLLTPWHKCPLKCLNRPVIRLPLYNSI